MGVRHRWGSTPIPTLPQGEGLLSNASTVKEAVAPLSSSEGEKEVACPRAGGDLPNIGTRLPPSRELTLPVSASLRDQIHFGRSNPVSGLTTYGNGVSWIATSPHSQLLAMTRIGTRIRERKSGSFLFVIRRQNAKKRRCPDLKLQVRVGGSGTCHAPAKFAAIRSHCHRDPCHRSP